MKRFAMAWMAAFCVGAGFVLGEFVRAVRPVDYLIRPLLAVAVLAVVIGVIASLLRGWSVVAAVFAMAWIVQPESPVALGVAVVAAGLVGWRLWKGRAPGIDTPLAVAAGVFLVTGLVPVIPLIPWSAPVQAAGVADGPPQYVILLDGYPRADTLAQHGFDVSPFISALEERGFDHYPDATTRHPKTIQALTAMTGGDPDDWREGDMAVERTLREQWRLPSGFVSIAPPMGFVTLPHTPTLNRFGHTFFESELLVRSVFLPVARDWIVDGYRHQLNHALEVTASTDERRVFAHLFAPHFPALYGPEGSLPISECWPYCATVHPGPPGIDVEERITLIGRYVEWLNLQLVDVVDRILQRRPDAEIVLFSDHGGRWDDADPAEWGRVFLASRTPTRPDLFSASPYPGEVFDRLVGSVEPPG